MQADDDFPEDLRARLQAYAEILGGSQAEAQGQMRQLAQTWDGACAGLGLEEKFRLFDALRHLCLAGGPADQARRREAFAPRRKEAIHLMHEAGFTSYQVAVLCDSTPVRVEHERRLAARTRKRRAFVIEDEYLLASEIRAFLEGLGFDVLGCAATEADALSHTRGRNIDLIIADVSLRGGNSGIVAANRARGGRPIPVIYLTGHAQLVEPLNMSAGDRVLEKPFDPLRLAATIEEVFALT